jgi:hypothetical protein
LTDIPPTAEGAEHLADNQGFVLLTSAFTPEGHSASQHLDEIYAAIATNLLNRFIVEVHLLTESDCHAVTGLLRQHSKAMPDESTIRQSIDRKLTCVSTPLGRQPSYADFFHYANTSLGRRMVLFSNADVVFDETLGDIDPNPIMRREYGYILSVKSPPHNGQYKKVFDSECDNQPRCTVGAWHDGGQWGQREGWGNSWDSYIFAPPLSPHVELSHIDLFMNFNGAESVAAFQLEKNGNLSLHNPCMHVHAYHWHCKGGKMHDSDPNIRADRPKWYTDLHHLPPHFPPDAVARIYPCWDCPGIDMPRGAVDREDYCQEGSLLGVDEVPELAATFRTPDISVRICCKEAKACRKLPIKSLPHCVTATDVDCVTWEPTGKHLYY